MRSPKSAAFKYLLSVFMVLGTAATPLPVMAQEDLSFEEDAHTRTTENEDISKYDDSKPPFETPMDEGEESSAVLRVYEETSMLDGELVMAPIEEESEKTEAVIERAWKTFDGPTHLLRDEGTAGISYESVPTGTPYWRDDRRKVANTKKFPNYAICKLYLIFENAYGNEEEYIGTGFFISPAEILTCAHCMYNHEDNLGMLKRIIIEPGSNADGKPYGTIDSRISRVRFQIPKTFVNATEPATQNNYDYGILKIDQPVKNRGFIRLSSGAGREANVHLIGYPGLARGDDSGLNQYEDWSTKSKIDGPRLESDVTGSGGQSGSPILAVNNEAVAIHGYGYSKWDAYAAKWMDLQWCGGVRFTLDVLYTLDTSFGDENSIESPIYRCYNPNSGEHVYTQNYFEVKNLIRVGWTYEGVAWRNEDETSGRVPVYRLYNHNAGDHHYTTSVREYNALRNVGWRGEGIVWYAPKDSRSYSKVYRLYNPNAKKAGAHHFTTNKSEYDHLCKIGWKGEGTAFNAR